ncbi:MAG: hypothetical protein GX066_04230 [Clostridiaceae bacterium]|nr:hypothetical protein [Clostridiaceae bacterium]
MLNKKLQSDIHIKNDGTLFSNNLKGINLKYYIIEDEIVNEDFNHPIKGYGIEIVKKEMTIDDTTIIESMQISNVYCSEKRTQELIDKLAYHTVTPVTLDYILEDIIGVL